MKLRSWRLALGTILLGCSRLPAQEPPVQLPPFLVGGDGGAHGWKYVKSPEFEILAQCDDAITLQAANGFHRLRELLAQILPPQFQGRSDVPPILLLYDEIILTHNSAEAVEMLKKAPGGLELDTGGADVGFLKNFSLSDKERMAVLVSIPATYESGAWTAKTKDSGSIMDPTKSLTSGLRASPGPVAWKRLTPAYVGVLLTSAAPRLPSWFETGFMNLYGNATFDKDSITLAHMEWSGSLAAITANFVPLSRLLTEHDQPASEVSTWVLECELFLRWALLNGKSDALWQFADRSRHGPADEAMFRACFGAGFAEVQQQMAGYLPKARRRAATLPPVKIDDLGNLPVRPASHLEIALLKGDFERLEAKMVAAEQPVMAPHYLNAAEGSLQREYDRGDRDPQLLAELGLCELDREESVKAQPFLEAAVAAHVIRPRAYLELAKLRYEDALNHVTTDDGKLSREQVANVLEPIIQSAAQYPHLEETASFIKKVFAHSRIKPEERRLDLFTGK